MALIGAASRAPLHAISPAMRTAHTARYRPSSNRIRGRGVAAVTRIRADSVPHTGVSEDDRLSLLKPFRPVSLNESARPFHLPGRPIEWFS